MVQGREFLAATSVVLSLGVLCDLSTVEAEFRSENFKQHGVNAMELHLVEWWNLKKFIDLGKAIAVAFQDKFVRNRVFLKKENPTNFRQGNGANALTFGGMSLMF